MRSDDLCLAGGSGDIISYAPLAIFLRILFEKLLYIWVPNGHIKTAAHSYQL